MSHPQTFVYSTHSRWHHYAWCQNYRMYHCQPPSPHKEITQIHVHWSLASKQIYDIYCLVYIIYLYIQSSSFCQQSSWLFAAPYQKFSLKLKSWLILRSCPFTVMVHLTCTACSLWMFWTLDSRTFLFELRRRLTDSDSYSLYCSCH